MNAPARQKRAVLYLRVSSRAQLETDYDEDGLSIAAQRSRCQEFARRQGALVVDEYVDRGESAKTDDRPELQRMLTRIREQRDVDLVIVHKVDRLARNRRDDANVVFDIHSGGATLVSATENIDNTPTGQLTHGVLASVAEYFSRNLANEVIKGMTEKAKRGGTPGQVPLGYLNVIERTGGYDVRTVEVDPERGPLISWAFDAYASGIYSLAELATLLEARGLRSRPTRKRASHPLGVGSMHRLLRNDYYVGVVTYRGEKYPGRHEPLVSPNVFARVQQVLDTHRLAGERDRKHSHYLKGTLFCGHCGRRLTYSRNNGNGGSYEYFVCTDYKCKLGYLPIDQVEAMVHGHYKAIDLSDLDRQRTLRTLRDHLRTLATISDNELRRCTALTRDLIEQERKLLQAHYDSNLSAELFDQEMARIQRERDQAEQIAARIRFDRHDLDVTRTEAGRLLDGGLAALYAQADADARRLINQAVFVAVWITNHDTHMTSEALSREELLRRARASRREDAQPTEPAVLPPLAA